MNENEILLFEWELKKDQKNYKVILRRTSENTFSVDTEIDWERDNLTSWRVMSETELTPWTQVSQINLFMMIMNDELKVENQSLNEKWLWVSDMKKRLNQLVEDVSSFVRWEYTPEMIEQMQNQDSNWLDINNQNSEDLEKELDDAVFEVSEVMEALIEWDSSEKRVREETPYEEKIHSHKYLVNNQKLKYNFDDEKTVLWVHFSSKAELENRIKEWREKVKVTVINEEIEWDNKIIWFVEVNIKYKRAWIIFWQKNIYSLSIEWKIEWWRNIKVDETVVKDFTFDYIADIMNKEIKKMIQEFKI